VKREEEEAEKEEEEKEDDALRCPDALTVDFWI
jgi:hypothetical protein